MAQMTKEEKLTTIKHSHWLAEQILENIKQLHEINARLDDESLTTSVVAVMVQHRHALVELDVDDHANCVKAGLVLGDVPTLIGAMAALINEDEKYKTMILLALGKSGIADIIKL